MRYARIIDGSVVETINVNEEKLPAEEQFAPEIWSQMVQSDIAEEDWLYDGSAFSQPPDNSPTLEEYQEQLCDQCEKKLPIFFEAGFEYDGFQIQGDVTAQQNAQAFLLKVMSGIATYPLYWRTRDNSFMPLNDQQSVMDFVVSMATFAEGEYQRIWTAKDAIRAAGTVEEAETIYSSYAGV